MRAKFYEPKPSVIRVRAEGSHVTKTKYVTHILQKLPVGHTFGAPYRREAYGVQELLNDTYSAISTETRDVRIWLVSLNRLKMKIEERISPTFDYNILHEQLELYDKGKTGMITFASLLEVMRANEIFFNIKNIRALMEFLGIIVADCIDYGKFIGALKGKIPSEKINSPGNKFHSLSTYQAACCDLIFPDENICRSPAGTPTRRLDERKPASPYSQKYVQLSDFTNVKACLQPSLFTQYSLSHRDFYCPREKDFIRALFRKIGCDMSDENFEKLWKIGTVRDCSERVCVETFRDLLNEYYPLYKKLNVDGVQL